jgi:hypothetical protein
MSSSTAFIAQQKEEHHLAGMAFIAQQRVYIFWQYNFHCLAVSMHRNTEHSSFK